MQVELPKAQETQKFKDGFDFEVFIADNWFYLLSLVVVVLFVYLNYKRKLKQKNNK